MYQLACKKTAMSEEVASVPSTFGPSFNKWPMEIEDNVVVDSSPTRTARKKSVKMSRASRTGPSNGGE